MERFDEGLLKKRQIYLTGEINNLLTDELIRAILFLNAYSETLLITVYFNCSGGSTLAGLDIYDIISHSKAPVEGIVLSKSASMAAIALQACSKRKILQNSNILLHNIRISVEAEWDELEEIVKKRIAAATRRQEIVYEILMKKTGLEREEIVQILKEKTSFTAEEALEKNLVDEIIKTY